MSQSQGIKTKLRPLRANNVQNMIAKNLQPLKENNKKLVAQTLYYQRNPENESPLTRPPKEPVHQRLGPKQIRLRRLPLGTNTSHLLPKRRPMMQMNLQQKSLNTPQQYRVKKLYKINTAQARLERIRAQHQQSNKTVRLRRLNNKLTPITNFTVQVNNPNFIPNGNHMAQGNYVRFKMILRPEIQAEIQELQAIASLPSVPLPLDTKVIPVTTEIPISTRFCLLS